MHEVCHEKDHGDPHADGEGKGACPEAFTGEDKPVSSDVLFEWIDEYYELDDKEAYEKEMQKQEAAQTSKKKKRTVKKPAKPLLDGLLGKEGGDAPDLKPSKVKKSRREELDGQFDSIVSSYDGIVYSVSDIRNNEKCGSTCFVWQGRDALDGDLFPVCCYKKENGDRQQEGCLGKGIYEDRI